MTESAQTARPNGPPHSTPSSAGNNRLKLFGVAIVLIAAGLIAGYVLGRNFAARDLTAASQLNQQLTSQGQALRQQVVGQTAQIGTLQAKLKGVQDQLEAIMPSQNSYVVGPNESLIVANGRLTIGLIGSPSNAAVNIIVNGKQQSAIAGDVISIAPTPATSCQVAVESFDMFKALLTAKCADTKPQ